MGFKEFLFGDTYGISNYYTKKKGRLEDNLVVKSETDEHSEDGISDKSQKTALDEPFYYAGRDNLLIKSPMFPKQIIKESKNVIIIVLENTCEISKYKNNIGSVIKKIVGDNKSSLFMFLILGKGQKFYDIKDYIDLETEKLIDNLLPNADEYNNKINLLDSLIHIDEFLNKATCSFYHKEKECEISSARIIFIGSAKYDDSLAQKDTAVLIKKIVEKTEVKTIKYFCIEDKQTINAAALGFPVIGHIVHDFYE